MFIGLLTLFLYKGTIRAAQFNFEGSLRSAMYTRQQRQQDGRIIIVYGTQWGSEAKGTVAEYLCPVASAAIRTGAANAGHTLYFNGQRIVMRQLPVGWTSGHVKLMIGAGAMISLDILLEEIKMIGQLSDIKDRIFIDEKAHVITPEDIAQEEIGDLAQRIGSTSARSREGIGAATANKVLRVERRIQAKEIPELQAYLADTSGLVNNILNAGEIVLIEGTQGHELSLDHGAFPYVTSRDTTVMAIAAASGIPIHEFDCDVVGVTRTYPIRVAGSSGPFGADSEELTWMEVSRRAGSIKGFEEQTTVTGLPRRVSTFSWEQFAKSCEINRPTEIALTFADYLDWQIHGKDYISRPVETFIAEIQKVAQCDVTIVQTGPESTIDMDSYRSSMLRRIR